MDREIRIKSVDIAKTLGLSKATVSLALNNRAGVSAKTRRQILDCRDEMLQRLAAESEQRKQPFRNGKSILIIYINRHQNVLCDPEMDMWSESLISLRKEAQLWGYDFQIEFMNCGDSSEKRILGITENAEIAGVIIYATEMTHEDEIFCRKIRKPVVLYDYDIADRSFSCVCIDAETALELSCEWLLEHGARKIKYIAIDKHAYNFTSRRYAYYLSMRMRGMEVYRSDIIFAGKRIEEVTAFMNDYLKHTWKGEALIMENFQITAGTILAARSLEINIPGELQLVGIDEIPDSVFGDIKIPMISIDSRERISLAVDLLDREISQKRKIKSRVFQVPTLIYDGKKAAGLKINTSPKGLMM